MFVSHRHAVTRRDRLSVHFCGAYDLMEIKDTSLGETRSHREGWLAYHFCTVSYNSRRRKGAYVLVCSGKETG